MGTEKNGKTAARSKRVRRSAKVRGGRVPPELRRTFVLEAARLEFSRSGPKGTTIEQIARSAGVNKRYIYEMFPDKQTLFEVVVEREVERGVRNLLSAFSEAEGLEPKEAVRRHFAAVFDFMARHPERARLIRIAMYDRTPKIRETIESARKDLMQRHSEVWRRLSLREIGGASSRTAEMLATMLFGMTEALATETALEGRFSKDPAVELLTEFTLGGLSWISRGK